MSEAKRWHELILPIGIIACLLVILVPLPPALLDVLLAANITIAVIVLLTTIQIKSPLEFAIFPTLLLATTLGRVVLNVATTRLILSRGAVDNSAAAGGVIQSFGEFVTGNQIAVGIIIFAIIIVVQFVVVTKGATRISEVAARFTLDGMPGRQMAIDADLNAGTIDGETAGQRRANLQEQADFYGAMDGAGKFVRGDAIAGILITAINIVGGLGIGISQGMSLSQAFETFTKLTIGDGLATQIPGLLISLAAGILISRSSKPSNLSSEFVAQLFAKPQVLWITGLFLAALAFTQLPAIPLLTVASGCIGTAMMLTKRESFQKQASKQNSSTEQKTSTAKTKHDANEINRFLNVDPLEIELGVNLIVLAKNGRLLDKITRAREAIAEELGIILPKVRVRDNLTIESNRFQLRINNLPIFGGDVYLDRFLAIRRNPQADALDEPVTNWHSGFGASWITSEKLAELEAAGFKRDYDFLTPAEVIVECLKQQTRIRAAEILTRQSTAYLIDQLRETCPATVNELIPDVMKVGQVQQVLQMLLAERVSIRQLNTILEALADYHDSAADLPTLTEHVRRRLSHWITANCSQHGHIWAIEFTPESQNWFEQRISYHEARYNVQLESSVQSRLFSWLQHRIEKAKESGENPILLVSSPLRPALRTVLMTRFPQLRVISHQEIANDAKIETIAILQLADLEYSAA